MIEIFITIFIIILIFLFFLLKSTKVPKQLYQSKAIYSDHKEKPETFFSKKYNLAGKPDFILHTKDGLLPLEIKHSKKPNQPYFSHVMQLISYCLLMEEKNQKPKYGFIQYKGGNPFSIPYTEKLKAFLLKTMDEMRNISEKPKPIKRNKCDYCSYKCFN